MVAQRIGDLRHAATAQQAQNPVAQHGQGLRGLPAVDLPASSPIVSSRT